MNYDLLSELLLAGVTFGICRREFRSRAALALGNAVIGCAALLGALIFAGVAAADGPHRLLSLLAACAALPLIAAGLRWQDGALTRRMPAALRFFLIACALCLLMVEVFQLAWWAEAIPALSAALILITAVQSRNVFAVFGALLLIACFGLSLAQLTFYPLDADQQLHILMSSSLFLLAASHPAGSRPALNPDQ